MSSITGRILCSFGLVFVWALAPLAGAQQTTGTIAGRVLDPQGSAIPGATVTATNTQTGFSRGTVSDTEGLYRLAALPVGTYDVKVELQGFATIEQKGLQVSVGQTVDANFDLKVAGLTETVTVSSDSTLIQTTSSSVGGLVDVQHIESLPLNGRQFANLALTIPGVGLGFHSDPTKSTQFSPQIAGGNGRNVNYLIDGGDNNDDTVGGLLQLFPLEAIQEFNFQTARYKAEYGRSNGGVMNIVTKSGTNQYQGSWFTLLRDDGMNAKTETETLNEVDKQSYRRYQFGGSIGGPFLKDRAHFFAAAERTQLDTAQTVDTLGLFPAENGVFTTPVRENLLTVKGTASLNAEPVPVGPLRAQHELAAVRRRPAGDRRQLGREREQLQLDQREPQLGARRVEAERVHLPVRRFLEFHLGQQPRSVSDLSERRHDRAEPQHAADDRAAQMAVPRRFLVAHARSRRPRPRSSRRA